MNFKEVVKSERFKKFICAFGVLVVAVLIFRAGEFVGHRKAGFAYGMGDNYYRAFSAPGRDERGGPASAAGGQWSGRGGMMGGNQFYGNGAGGMMRGFFQDDFSDSHGVAGKILSVKLPTLVIDGADGVEKVVSVGSDTLVRDGRNTIEASSLKEGAYVVVIGTPNSNSVIEAKLIRVSPAPRGEVISPVGTSSKIIK